MNAGEKPIRKRVLFRWSLFLLTVLLALCTLFVLVRSGEEGWTLRIRKPEIAASRSTSKDFWVVHIGWSYLGFRSEVGMRTPFSRTSGLPMSGPASLPWFEAKKTPPYLGIFDWPLKVPLFVVLSAECLALFFLVPSVVGRAGRR